MSNAKKQCEWSEIEPGSGVYNTCKPGEEFNLTEGMELWPHCHWCGGKIFVVDDSANKPSADQSK